MRTAHRALGGLLVASACFVPTACRRDRIDKEPQPPAVALPRVDAALSPMPRDAIRVNVSGASLSVDGAVVADVAKGSGVSLPLVARLRQRRAEAPTFEVLVTMDRSLPLAAFVKAAFAIGQAEMGTFLVAAEGRGGPGAFEASPLGLGGRPADALREEMRGLRRELAALSAGTAPQVDPGWVRRRHEVADGGSLRDRLASADFLEMMRSVYVLVSLRSSGAFVSLAVSPGGSFPPDAPPPVALGEGCRVEGAGPSVRARGTAPDTAGIAECTTILFRHIPVLREHGTVIVSAEASTAAEGVLSTMAAVTASEPRWGTVAAGVEPRP